ncbi:MAG: DUF7715 family protein [Acidimicrobiia bacterium]
MKVFVATARTQGRRPDDFCWTVEGELVRFPGVTCNCPGCGCDRAMAGLSSSRATTTFTVRDLPDLDGGAFGQLLADALQREGWLRSESAEDEAWAAGWAREHLSAAARFEEERVLELRRGRIIER